MSEIPAKAAQLNYISEIIESTQHLAESVGPGWGLAILVAILLLLPKYGVLVHLAELFKEDRIDARKRKLDSARLEVQLSKRNPAGLLPPPKSGPSPRKKGK